MKIRRCLAAAALIVIAVGCGESGPSLVPVTGVVTCNGKPLEGAVIVFHPDSTNKEGLPGEDITGPDGNYVVNSNGRSGLVPGKYHILVTKLPENTAPVYEAFKDDPYMAQLSSNGPELRRGAASRKRTHEQLEGAFDRDVAPSGGIQDFDVKFRAASVAR